jgi:2-phospho-L-lactate/phosphoenolpyruvate guanylyltransferase
MQPTGTAEHTCALVPLRTGGKTRLGTVLPPSQREALALAMLDDVLAALRDAGVDDVRVLAAGDAALAAAARRGLAALRDPTPAGTARAAQHAAVDEGIIRLRAAVDHGLADVGSSRTRLVVAADLPLLTGEDVRAVLAALAAQPGGVVVSPTPSGGTAVLGLAPGVVLASQHGPDSAEAHAAAARALGVPVTRLELDGGRDVDDPDDLALLPRLLAGRRSATATVLGVAHG